MDWFATTIVFAVVWWLILFMVLPFGAAPPDEVEPGMATSAPARPRLGIKLAITTVFAILVTGLIMWALGSGLIELRPKAGPAGASGEVSP
jgi:predicted secreted protein